MNLLKQTGDQLQYGLDENEAKILRVLLAQFPYSKPSPGKISTDRHCAETLDRQKLLDESLAAHRAGMKQLAEKVARDGISQNAEGWQLSINSSGKESLLQILNDIRVGMWHDIGEPDDLNEPPKDSPQLLQQWSIMQLASHFVAGLVHDES